MKTAAGGSSSSSTSRLRNRKKRKQVDDDEEDILIHSSDDDELIEAEDVTSMTSKKQRKEQPNKKKPVIVPHKAARALNDAFKDFQSNFGLSSPSNTTNKARSTPSIQKSKQTGFKSSFDDDTSANTKATSTRDTVNRVRNETTPLKQSTSSLKSGASLLRPPESHKRLLDETSQSASTRTDASKYSEKGKGRATEVDEPSSDNAESSETVHEEHSAERQDDARPRNQGITPLLHLSAKKQFKVPSTPSRPSSLKGRQLPSSTSRRLETPSTDIKPLKSLGAISGLDALRKPNPTLASNQTRAGDKITLIEHEEQSQQQQQKEEEEEEHSKPKWAKLLNDKTKNEALIMQQDITELLSPRKKRKGWVPSGFAENASSIIKRLQTGNNLWIHEIYRLILSSTSSSSSSRISTNALRVKKENTDSTVKQANKINSNDNNKKTYESLMKDLNPHLRLVILEILSPKPASLTWSSQEGGFITAGSAEKLLITRCRILKDEEEDNDDDYKAIPTFNKAIQNLNEDEIQPQDKVPSPPSTANIANPDWESQIEGMVIFSLNAHSRTSTGITMVRKEQPRPSRDETQANEGDRGSNHVQIEDRLQPQLKFRESESDLENRRNKKCNIYLPASVADLHTQMRVEDEIWAWEPWSVVDLAEDISLKASAEDSNEKALLVSRFAVLL